MISNAQGNVDFKAQKWGIFTRSSSDFEFFREASVRATEREIGAF